MPNIQAHQEPPFLSLPGEIREQIYQHLFSASELIVTVRQSQNNLCPTNALSLQIAAVNFPTALYSTCRAIYGDLYRNPYAGCVGALSVRCEAHETEMLRKNLSGALAMVEEISVDRRIGKVRLNQHSFFALRDYAPLAGGGLFVPGLGIEIDFEVVDVRLEVFQRCCTGFSVQEGQDDTTGEQFGADKKLWLGNGYMLQLVRDKFLARQGEFLGGSGDWDVNAATTITGRQPLTLWQEGRAVARVVAVYDISSEAVALMDWFTMSYEGKMCGIYEDWRGVRGPAARIETEWSHVSTSISLSSC